MRCQVSQNENERFIKTKLLLQLRYLGGVEVGISCNSVLHLVTLYTEMPLTCRNQSLQPTWNCLRTTAPTTFENKEAMSNRLSCTVLCCVYIQFNSMCTYILIRSAMHAYTHQHRYMTNNANVMQQTYSNTKKNEENVEHFRRKMN